MKCIRCGKSFDGAYCPYCGAGADGTVKCPSCGEENEADFSFCRHCGASLKVGAADGGDPARSRVPAHGAGSVRGFEDDAWVRLTTPFLALAFLVLNLIVFFSDFLSIDLSILGSWHLGTAELLTRRAGDFYQFYGEFDSPEILAVLLQCTVAALIILSVAVLLRAVCTLGRSTVKTRRTDIVFSALFTLCHLILLVAAYIAKRDTSFFEGYTNKVQTSAIAATVVSFVFLALSIFVFVVAANRKEFPHPYRAKNNEESSAADGKAKGRFFKNKWVRLLIGCLAEIFVLVFLIVHVMRRMETINTWENGSLLAAFAIAIIAIAGVMVVVAFFRERDDSDGFFDDLSAGKTAAYAVGGLVLGFSLFMLFLSFSPSGGNSKVLAFCRERYPDIVLSDTYAKWAEGRSLDTVEECFGEPYEKTEDYLIYCSSSFRKLKEQEKELNKQLGKAKDTDRLKRKAEALEEQIDRLCYTYLRIGADGSVTLDTRHRNSNSLSSWVSDRGYSWNKKVQKTVSVKTENFSWVCKATYTDGSYISSSPETGRTDKDGNVEIRNSFGDLTLSSEKFCTVEGRTGFIGGLIADIFGGRKEVTLTYVSPLLTEFKIPDDVEKIGKGAFSRCARLRKITIPESVTSIGSSAFYDCDSLTSITYGGTKEQWRKINKSGIPSCVIHCADGDIGE